MKCTEVKVRVLYADTDKMGVVYYAKYLEYFEYARTELFRSLGYSYKDVEEEGIILPVRNANINYLKSAYYDDLLSIHVKLLNFNAKMEFAYEIKNEKQELLTTGTTTHPFVNINSGRVIRPPKWFLNIVNEN